MEKWNVKVKKIRKNVLVHMNLAAERASAASAYSITCAMMNYPAASSRLR